MRMFKLVFHPPAIPLLILLLILLPNVFAARSPVLALDLLDPEELDLSAREQLCDELF